MESTPLFNKISQQIQSNDVVLYMKGTADLPMCGFSGFVVQILKKLQISFLDVNVLDDPEIREGIKEFSQWPTLPQLYIKSEFVGGCDILRDMYNSGELIELLEKKEINFNIL